MTIAVESEQVMLRIGPIAFVVLLSIMCPSERAMAATPAFEQYPVDSVFEGPTQYPDFKGRDRAYREYRTRIRDGLKKGPNFAGSFSVVQIGCGTGCSFVYLASNRTGKVFPFPRGGEDNAYLQLRFLLTSTLLYAQWYSYETDTCKLERLAWTGEDFKLLASDSIGKADTCYGEIDANIGRASSAPGVPEP